MLSYQHEYHAGNHADILKHTCLCLIMESLCKKEKPFTVIDSHSGAGIFDLDDDRLLKTMEARNGIEKIYSFYKKTSTEFPFGLKRYLEMEADFLEQKKYAGSPELERLYSRENDSLHFIEKHPQAFDSLKLNMTNRKVHIHKADSYESLNALTPPLIRRGLVLCDPSYEDSEDYKKVCGTLKTVRRKWNTAIIALWYPLLVRRKNETAQLLTELEDFCRLGTSPCESIRIELTVRKPEDTAEEGKASHLYGSGMFIMNPPWKLKEELEESCSFIKKLFEII